MTGSSWPILLKKSNSVPKTEKYVQEIEIVIFSRCFRMLISRSGLQKTCL